MNTRLSITAIVLTKDEELHIERCMNSLLPVVDRIVVVDSGSVDSTVDIAYRLGAHVYVNEWVNYSRQFNWALDNAVIDTGWVLRLDADEVLTPELIAVLPEFIRNAEDSVSGYTLNLRRIFYGKFLKHGALYPIRLLRLFRTGRGRCENTWMDEHIIVDGNVEHIDYDFCDNNLNGITWWTMKHNGYASREAVDVVMRRLREIADPATNGRAGFKRWVKNNVYSKFPLGVRAFLYFFYRYFLALGIFDGWQGLVYNFLQACWYRFLVDVKIKELTNAMERRGLSLEEAAYSEFGLKLSR